MFLFLLRPILERLAACAQTLGLIRSTITLMGNTCKGTASHEKSYNSLWRRQQAGKVAPSRLPVVRVSKHNRPWGHTAKNRRNGETRLLISARPETVGQNKLRRSGGGGGGGESGWCGVTTRVLVAFPHDHFWFPAAEARLSLPTHATTTAAENKHAGGAC